MNVFFLILEKKKKIFFMITEFIQPLIIVFLHPFNQLMCSGNFNPLKFDKSMGIWLILSFNLLFEPAHEIMVLIT